MVGVMAILLIVLVWGIGSAIAPPTMPAAIMTLVAPTICTKPLAMSIGGQKGHRIRGNKRRQCMHGFGGNLKSNGEGLAKGWQMCVTQDLAT